MVKSLHYFIISFTQKGYSLSTRLKSLLGEEVNLAFGGKISDSNELLSIYKPLSEWVQLYFQQGNALIFIGAAGIAVRAIAPFLKSKITDPAVLVMDEMGSFVIPILSGHIGGANALARKIAALLGAQAVLTTASDVNNVPAIDEFATQNNLSINDMEKAREFAANVLNESCYPGSESALSYIPQFTVSAYIKSDILSLIPKCVILGIGCKKGKSTEELKNFVREMLEVSGIDSRSIAEIASIDLKKDEKAIISLSESLKVPFVTFSAEKLNEIPQKVSQSVFVSQITGTDNVCERAVFAAGADELILSKTARNGMTIAIGIRKINIEIPEKLKKYWT